VVQTGAVVTPGLRERKKQRTRATLIDVAVDLCLAQGYENTTVEQIAANADVSPRTFSRYFATKGAVFMALLDDYVDAVADELRALPAEVPPLTAMRDSHLAALRRFDPGSGRTDESIRRMLAVINSTPELKRAAAGWNPVSIENALAQRMGVEAGDRRLRLVVAVWSAIIVTGCGDLVGGQDGLALGPELMAQRIRATYDDFAELTSALRG
jgi:AcrR family transcriptional regulator